MKLQSYDSLKKVEDAFIKTQKEYAFPDFITAYGYRKAGKTVQESLLLMTSGVTFSDFNFLDLASSCGLSCSATHFRKIYWDEIEYSQMWRTQEMYEGAIIMEVYTFKDVEE